MNGICFRAKPTPSKVEQANINGEMKMTLVAFNGDEQLKKDLVREVIKHRKADAIIKGTYGYMSDTEFRGCAVGCSLRSYNLIKGLNLSTHEHVNYEQFGIPRLLARLEDGIFEGLPSTHNKKWPEQFMSAINVGADLSTVWPKFAQFLLTDKKHGVIKYARTDEQRAAIQKVSDLYRDGGSIDDFKLARSAAAYADAYAAYAAADAAYAAAAYAAYAADAAYAAAAYADADAAYADARYEARIAQSKYLIKLLKECN